MLIQTVTCVLFLIGFCNACVERDYGYGSSVCVCTKNVCDSLDPVKRLNSKKFVVYTSSKSGKRFNRNVQTVSQNGLNNNNSSIRISISHDRTYQKIDGFGGAFTDSAGINIKSLSNQTQETLMNAYFSKKGIEYSMGRVPIAGSDFSTRGYTYDDITGDYSLQYFSLQPEDTEIKIPLIKEAFNLTNNDMKLFATAWTAPAWMKTNNKLTGIAFLNQSMFELWAEYHVKFFEAYKNQGVYFWGLTTGNEPANGFLEAFHINDMGWIPELQARWIAECLGPKMKLHQTTENIKIITVDDQRVFFPWIPRLIMENNIAASYIDGFGVHYYTDQYVPAEVLTITHYDFQSKFILATEACEGSVAQQQVVLGSWERAERYLHSIIDDLNNWSTGWMDWNIALDTEGGPTYVSNYVDSPIIVNKTADEFYKQPMFYAMGHFSKFIRPNSVRIDSTIDDTSTNLMFVAFDRPDQGTVVSVFNPTDDDTNVTVTDAAKNKNIFLLIEKHSINTIMYW